MAFDQSYAHDKLTDQDILRKVFKILPGYKCVYVKIPNSDVEHTPEDMTPMSIKENVVIRERLSPKEKILYALMSDMVTLEGQNPEV